MKKLKVAITGSIGSGKTLFSEYLKAKGFTVINADEISKELLVSDEKIKEKIKKVFGDESYIETKMGHPSRINKKFLAEKVFSNPENVLKINSIIHPKVIEEINKLFETKFKEEELVFVEAALIYEADMESMFDYVVLITADEKIRMERKINSGMSREDFLKRNENQIKDEEKKKRADFVFENNGTKKDLEKKADLFLKIL